MMASKYTLISYSWTSDVLLHNVSYNLQINSKKNAKPMTVLESWIPYIAQYASSVAVKLDENK